MQRYSCNVRPGAELTHEVPRINISAAEIMVLQHIHGEGSVVNIRVGKGAGDKTTHKDEYDRLVEQYGLEKVAPVLGSGFAINLPNRLSDIGIAVEGDVEQAKTAATITKVNGIEVDKAGLPHDGRIHVSTKATTIDGFWKKKKGVTPELLEQVEDELRTVMAVPGPGTTEQVAADGA